MNKKNTGNKSGYFSSNITRRESLKQMAGAGAALLAGSMSFPASLPGRSGRKKPNIIFILTDDHRWDCLSIMGHPFLKTKNMDRIGKEGVIFENAFVTTSLCSPSRASFLTGQYASVHGVKNNATKWSEKKNITYMEHLKKAGYDTAFIGKWHMPGGKLPNLPGVDKFVSFTRKDGQGDYYNCPIYVNHKLAPARKEYITEELTDYALDFISEKRKNPFCLYLSHKAVHHDWKPPAHLKGMYDDVDLDGVFAPESDKYNTWTNLNWLEGTMSNMHTTYRRYCECLMSVDEQIGRVFKLLEKKGILDDTLIVYAGDNGYIWGEHRLYAKHYPYEESIRIPFMVRPPANFISKKGRRIKEMVLNIDLAPSLLAAAGVSIPGKMQGRNFLALMKKRKVKWRKSFIYELFQDFPFGGRVPPHKALRTERYKLIKWKKCRKNHELYDLKKDPREMKNLYRTPEGKKIAAGLEKKLKAKCSEFQIVQ